MVTKKEYAKIVQKHAGKSPIVKDTIRAFWVGGLVCTIGQFFRNLYSTMGLDKEMTGTATSITLIFIASMLTAAGVFDRIGKFAGAGTLVPITGFSNAVTSPAMEFKTEGFVPGTAAKLFDVAGPVIVYGTLSSVIAGIIYMIFMR
ncbi:MAG: stage V sporulation protein AC [Ruminococcaceae bacterium]|nr:stage V sporulation protein AC [Oscillospiraceae bacterium]